MTEPSTEAGRRMLERVTGIDPLRDWAYSDDILAIEAEARASARPTEKQLAEALHVVRNHVFDGSETLHFDATEYHGGLTPHGPHPLGNDVIAEATAVLKALAALDRAAAGDETRPDWLAIGQTAADARETSRG